MATTMSDFIPGNPHHTRRRRLTIDEQRDRITDGFYEGDPDAPAWYLRGRAALARKSAHETYPHAHTARERVRARCAALHVGRFGSLPYDAGHASGLAYAGEISACYAAARRECPHTTRPSANRSEWIRGWDRALADRFARMDAGETWADTREG